jgi:hypothetical protein
MPTSEKTSLTSVNANISGVASFLKSSLNCPLVRELPASPAVEPLKPVQKRARLVLAPKDFFISPFFAAKPHIGARQVTVGHRHYHIGGFHPLDKTQHPPALDVRHARAIFALLSFRTDPLDKTQLIRFSFNQFCKQYASSNGGRYSNAIKKILRDLTNSFIRITDTKTGVAHSYRLIERVDIEERPIRRKDARLATSPQLEMWFNSCTLSPEFAGLLGDIEELQHLRFDVFNAIRSPIAQAIYLYIPSRAYYHHSQNDPFEINLTNLLEQISISIPFHKSKRKELFSKHADEGRSILQQLDGLETLSGVFHVQLADTVGGKDFKLLAWIDKRSQPKSTFENSKLVAIWKAGGRTLEQLHERLAQVEPLNDCELDWLEKAAIPVAGNEGFFRLAKAMLPQFQFESLLAEAKCEEQEGRAAKKNQTARLIWRIKLAIKDLVSSQSGLDNGRK